MAAVPSILASFLTDYERGKEKKLVLDFSFHPLRYTEALSASLWDFARAFLSRHLSSMRDIIRYQQNNAIKTRMVSPL